jgi:hypothetical protein
VYRRNPYLKCNSCGQGNLRSNPGCGHCGSLLLRKNPDSSYEHEINNLYLIQDYAEKIYSFIPHGQGLRDWMEHFLAVIATDLSDIVHSMRHKAIRNNPEPKYMAKANARLIKSYAAELLELLHDYSDDISVHDWMRSKFSSCVSRLDSVWHAIEFKQEYALSSYQHPKAKKSFKHNPDSVELNTGVTNMLDDDFEDDFDENPGEDGYLRNPEDDEFLENPEIFDEDDEDDDDLEISSSFSKYRRRNVDSGNSQSWLHLPIIGRKDEIDDVEDEIDDVEDEIDDVEDEIEDLAPPASRNPQKAFWDRPVFGQDWGKPLFRGRRRNPVVGRRSWRAPTSRRLRRPLRQRWGRGGRIRKLKSPRHLTLRNPQKAFWDRPVFGQDWGKPLFRGRRNPTYNRQLGSYRRNSDVRHNQSMWDDPSITRRSRRYRRNAARVTGRRGSAPIWSDPTIRPSSSFRRNASRMYGLKGSRPIWDSPTFDTPLWGDSAFTKRRFRRNSDPWPNQSMWDDPSITRRNPAGPTAHWAPCVGCGMAICDCGCAGNPARCSCAGRATRRRRYRRNA